jgi:hypothetical protein
MEMHLAVGSAFVEPARQRLSFGWGVVRSSVRTGSQM